MYLGGFCKPPRAGGEWGRRCPWGVAHGGAGGAVAASPFAQFRAWLAQAEAAALPKVNAMALATADPTGAPSVRMVLLKEMDETGFVFFTNYESRKGRELEARHDAALLFFWDALDRQVRTEGGGERVFAADSDVHF